jgi:aldehyde:ferredoxin oxidoreductase
LERIGLRITLARQIFHMRAGWTLERYSFPDRALGKPPLEGGELKGVSVDLQALARDYLREAGWDEKTGLPSPEVLRALNLSRFMTGA